MNSANLRHAISWTDRGKRLALALAAAAALTACGSGNDGAPAPGQSRMSGQVTDMLGAPIADVKVRLENRLTNVDYTVVTNAEGSFSVAVSPGVYDVLYDDLDQLNYVSQQHTAVDLQRDRNASVRLESAGSMAANLLYGSAVDTTGAPASNKKLLVIPVVLRSPAQARDLAMQAPFRLETDHLGRFSTPMGYALQDYEADVYVMADDAPAFDLSPSDENHVFDSEESRRKYHKDFSDYLSKYARELVDIDKPDGAMDLRLVIGAGVRNIHGATGIDSVVAADARALQDQREQVARAVSLRVVLTAMAAKIKKGVGDLIPSAYAAKISKLFRFESLDDDYRGLSREGVLTGRLDATPEYGRLVKLQSILDAESQKKNIDPDFLEQSGIYIRTLSWKDLGERLRGKYFLSFKTPRSGLYKFTDRTDDTYSLRVYLPGSVFGHTIYYFSEEPDIVKITYKFVD